MPEMHLPPGTDPTDPEVIKQLQAAEKRILADHAARAGDGDLSELADLKDNFAIMGQPCRPISAGLTVILQKIEHPLVTPRAGDSDEDDYAEEDMPLEDVAILIFLMIHPNEEELIDWAMDGSLQRRALKWAFTIDQAWMDTAVLEMQMQLDEYARAADVYAGGDADPEKKPEERPPPTTS